MNQLDIYKKIRKDWGNISPITKVKKSRKVYDRQRSKQEIKKILKQEDF